MVVTEVRNTGSMSTSMVAVTEALVSWRCRISRKKRVTICTPSAVAMVSRIMGILEFIIEKANLSLWVSMNIQPKKPSIDTVESIITARVTARPGTLRKFSSSMKASSTTPMRMRPATSAVTVFEMIPRTYGSPPRWYS